MILAKTVFEDIKKLANQEEAQKSLRFFKVGKGQYGEGDKFLGLQLSDFKNFVKKYANDISLIETEKLLQNPWHEVRGIALAILVKKYQKFEQKIQKEIVDIYIRSVDYINNWDLVDMSAGKILGAWVYENNDRKIIYKLAESNHLWSERIAVVACQYLIKQNDFKDILKLSEYFINHKHDLMHKAVGWMLREVGKKDEKVLKDFLDKNATKLPRTALRYSLEKFDEKSRNYYMKLK